MSKVITISGWGQAHDALANVVPEGSSHINYGNLRNAGAFLEEIKGQTADVIVGWSLGGQLALRAISEGAVKARAVVLIATPYQFVANKEIKCAMDRDTFNVFYSNFASDPVKTIKRFITLIGLNDSNSHEVITKLRESVNTENLEKWLVWLEELEKFSCNAIDFSQIPETYAIHGRDDTIVDCTQTGLFRSLIQSYNLEIFKNCGHAPHLHNSARVKEIIQSIL